MTLEQRIERLDKKLTLFIQRSKKETWVTPGIIYVATGWDHNTLKVMKREGVVKYNPITKRYLLESIPDIFVKS